METKYIRRKNYVEQLRAVDVKPEDKRNIIDIDIVNKLGYEVITTGADTLLMVDNGNQYMDINGDVQTATKDIIIDIREMQDYIQQTNIQKYNLSSITGVSSLDRVKYNGDGYYYYEQSSRVLRVIQQAEQYKYFDVNTMTMQVTISNEENKKVQLIHDIESGKVRAVKEEYKVNVVQRGVTQTEEERKAVKEIFTNQRIEELEREVHELKELVKGQKKSKLWGR